MDEAPVSNFPGQRPSWARRLCGAGCSAAAVLLAGQKHEELELLARAALKRRAAVAAWWRESEKGMELKKEGR